ncbi:hypothetical protein JTB14_003307 [Gonioctena quinquepunctata]|nr:hypothetical protein JTB14_003307 [Gonioctena quinquepunctata]
MGGKIEPFFLSEEDIDYELRIRDSKAPRKTITSKRIILSRLLGQETETTKLLDEEFDVEEEKAFINKTLADLESLIMNFRGPSSDPMNNIIETRLTYLTGRVKRFIIPAKPEEDKNSSIDFKDHA